MRYYKIQHSQDSVTKTEQDHWRYIYCKILNIIGVFLLGYKLCNSTREFWFPIFLVRGREIFQFSMRIHMQRCNKIRVIFFTLEKRDMKDNCT